MVDFRPTAPQHVPAVPVSPGELEFLTPTQEFRLSRIELGAPLRIADDGPQILVCVRGSARIEGGPTLTPGRSAYLPASGGPVRLAGEATLFRAKVPRPS